MRIAVSILGLMLMWGTVGSVRSLALVSETGLEDLLQNERWERRDPFIPLVVLDDPNPPLVDVASVVDEEYRYDPDGRRDPFRSVLDVDQRPVVSTGPLTPLEQFEPSQLQLAGIVWNSEGYRAMLETPDGLAYTARLGTAIGGNGVVFDINEERLVVRQSYQGAFGETKTREVELTLYTKEGKTAPSSPY